MKPAIAFITAPFFWASLPLPGIASLIQKAQDSGYHAQLFDLNLAYYLALPKMKKDWTVNSDYFEQGSRQRLDSLAPAVLMEFWKKMKETEYSFFGFTVFKSNLDFVRSLSLEIRGHYPEAKIIWGGPEMFSISQKTSGFAEFPFVDHFVIGEGEKALDDILLGKGKNIYAFEQEKSLMGYPRYIGIDLHNYPRRSTLALVSSRGCINQCLFCTERQLFHAYRFRGWEDIFEEILFHVKGHSIKHFIFYDSLFNGHFANIEKLCQALINENLGITWEAQMAIRKGMDFNLLNLMIASGCVNLFIGLESGSGEVLEKMKKPFTPEEAGDFFKLMKKAGLQFEVSLIAGFPGEEESHHQETMRFLIEHKEVIPKIAQVSCYQEYPGIQSGAALPPMVAKKRLKDIHELLIQEKIAFTPSYINNLV